MLLAPPPFPVAGTSARLTGLAVLLMMIFYHKIDIYPILSILVNYINLLFPGQQRVARIHNHNPLFVWKVENFLSRCPFINGNLTSYCSKACESDFWQCISSNYIFDCYNWKLPQSAHDPSGPLLLHQVRVNILGGSILWVILRQRAFLAPLSLDLHLSAILVKIETKL